MTSKVIAILMTFEDGTEHSLTEIARLSGLPISTAHRLATELAGWAILERTEDSHYKVGMQLRAIAGGVCSVPPSFHERARRLLEDLAAATRCMVRLGVFEGIDIAYIEKCATNRPVSLVFESELLPPHATAMGKALLAFASPALLDKVLARGLRAYTPLTIVTADRLRHALSVTRLTRIAVARRELEPDTYAVGAPVFGFGGAVVAALELGVSNVADLRQLQAPLVVAARSLTRELQADAACGPVAISPRRQLDVLLARNLAREPQRRAS